LPFVFAEIDRDDAIGKQGCEFGTIVAEPGAPDSRSVGEYLRTDRFPACGTRCLCGRYISGTESENA
jgi:hypothetical protein